MGILSWCLSDFQVLVFLRLLANAFFSRLSLRRSFNMLDFSRLQPG